MNRQQRRAAFKREEHLDVESIAVTFTDGSTVNLDPTKIMIIDKDTKANLFQHVMEQKEG